MRRQSIKFFDTLIKKAELIFRCAMKKLHMPTFGIRTNQNTRINSWSRASIKAFSCLSRLLRANQCYFAGNSPDVTLEFTHAKFPSLFSAISFNTDSFPW